MDEKRYNVPLFLYICHEAVKPVKRSISTFARIKKKEVAL